MGRKRKRGMEGFPPRTYCTKGRFYEKHEDGHETFLAPDTATREEVWVAYLKRPKAPIERDALTLRQLCDAYQVSPTFRNLSPTTQHDARRALETVCLKKGKRGGEMGALAADSITAPLIRVYMDERGEVSKKRANLERSYLSGACAWGYERGKVKSNPCKGVRPFKLKDRTRYVTDAEFVERFKLAGELGRVDVQAMMELAYLCRLRENEILKIIDTPAAIGPQGLLARRGKGSKTQLIEWSPRLENAIALARSVRRKISTPCLIISPFTGRPLRLGTFRNAWQQLRIAAAKAGQPIDWHFHDLKAKGVTDFEGDKHKASGHKTVRMTEVYNRLPEKVESTR